MKTVTVDGVNVVIIRQRGLGDGFAILRYFVDEGDGTYSSIGEGWSDKTAADAVYEKPDDKHLAWVIEEARRQTAAPQERPEQKPRPAPVVETDAAIK